MMAPTSSGLTRRRWRSHRNAEPSVLVKFRYGAESFNHAYFLLSGDSSSRIARLQLLHGYINRHCGTAGDYGTWGKRFSFGLGNDPDWSREVHTPDSRQDREGLLAFNDGDLEHFSCRLGV